ncbi:MAG: hypothetical protein HQ572_02795, partial [Candidatus Omnitrophica bacterium]|nr:hypothetical protein [Candidatus Omnitrophota bacterium]
MREVKEIDMPARSRYSIFLRTIAWIVLITFSWQQIASAADFSSLRWNHREKKTSRTYRLLNFIKQQKKQQSDLKQKSLTEYHRNRQVQGIFNDLSMTEYLNNLESRFASMNLWEQLWKAQGLVNHADTTYAEIKNFDGSIKRIYSRSGDTIAILNEHIDKGFGHTTIRNTINMEYSKGLLTSYFAVEQDYLGRITFIYWSDALYTEDSLWYGGYDTNANKNLTQFRETRITHEGYSMDSSLFMNALSASDYSIPNQLLSVVSYNTDGSPIVTVSQSDRYVTNGAYEGKNMVSHTEAGYTDESGYYYFERIDITYDTDHNMTAYNEVGWSQTLGNYWSNWQGTYSANPVLEDDFQLIGYQLTGWSEAHGQEYSVSWNANFDNSGRITSFTQIESSVNGGTTTIVKDEIEYDNDLMTAYTDTLTDANGEVTILRFSGGEYDSQDNLTQSIKKLTDAVGNVTTTEYTASYNSIRQVIEDEEVIEDEFGIIHTTQRSNITYDILGRITSYYQVIVSSDNPNVVTETTYTGIAYDATSQMADFDAVIHMEGRDSQGVYVNITETISREDVTFDGEDGTLLSYTEIVTKEGTNLYGYTVDTITEKLVIYDTAVNSEGITYAVPSNYQETVHTQGESTISLPSGWEGLTREQKISYLEGIDFTVGGIEVDFANLSTDEDENLTMQTDFVDGNSITLSDGSTAVLDPAELIISLSLDVTEDNDYSYIRNSSNQIVGYILSTHSSATPSLQTTINRTLIRYDAAGDIRGYVDTVTSNRDNLTQVTTVGSIVYDAASRIMSQTKQDHAYGTSSSGQGVNTVYNSLQSDMSYDAEGNLIGYTEVATSSVTQVESTDVVSGITYNGLGQTHSKSVRTISITTFEGLDYEVTSEQVVYASTYNEVGQLIGGVNYTIQDGVAELYLAQAISSLTSLESQVNSLLNAAQENLDTVNADLLTATDQTEIDTLNEEKSYYEQEIAALNLLLPLITDAQGKMAELAVVLATMNDDIIEPIALEARIAADAVVDAFQYYIQAISSIY